MQNFAINRRSLLRLTPGLLLPGALGCTSAKFFEEMGTIDVNQKALAARRADWKGPEMAFAVVSYGGGFVMVKHNSPLGWAFPGGDVDPARHGSNVANGDLVSAATNYAHSQALLPIQVSKTTLFAYGYGIDKTQDRMVMAYWFQIGLPTDFPPTPQANLQDSLDAKWVAPDDSKLSPCLEERIHEYETAGEGGTTIIDTCSMI
ncbi:MAG: hypothetical protein GC154_13860 [bacterium]|nr:hypothetical protein [bacterium]